MTRRALAGMALACGAVAWGPAALAQEAFPARPIKIVVAYNPGGVVDAAARLVATELTKTLGQPVVVESRPGAGGLIAGDYVAKAKPDGYTLLTTLGYSLPSNTVLYKKLPFDAQTALLPVSELTINPGLLLVPASLPIHNVRELIAWGKAHPGKLTMGSWAPGSTPNLIQTTLNKQYGTDIVDALYKGEAPIVLDLLGGQINLAYVSTNSAKQHVEGGKLRALAVIGQARSKQFPNVPTFIEQGFQDEVFKLWPPTSVFAPAGTPPEVVDKLGKAMAAAMQQPEVRRPLEDMGSVVTRTDAEQAQASFKRYFPIVRRLTQETGVQAQ